MTRFKLTALLAVMVALGSAAPVFAAKFKMLPCDPDPVYANASGTVQASIVDSYWVYDYAGNRLFREYETVIQYEFRGLPQGDYMLVSGVHGSVYLSDITAFHVGPDGTGSGQLTLLTAYKYSYYGLWPVAWDDTDGWWQRIGSNVVLCSAP